MTKGDAPDIEHMNASVRKMLEGAIQSDGIEELFETGKHLSVDIFSDEYMDKINAIQLPNTKIKILQRLLGLLFRLLWELMTEATKRCPLCSPISCSKTAELSHEAVRKHIGTEQPFML